MIWRNEHHDINVHFYSHIGSRLCKSLRWLFFHLWMNTHSRYYKYNFSLSIGTRRFKIDCNYWYIHVKIICILYYILTSSFCGLWTCNWHLLSVKNTRYLNALFKNMSWIIIKDTVEAWKGTRILKKGRQSTITYSQSSEMLRSESKDREIVFSICVWVGQFWEILSRLTFYVFFIDLNDHLRFFLTFNR